MTSFTPLFKANWDRAVFIHFRASAAKLQRLVPFPLDTWQGDALVSLVAFTQSRLRPCSGGRVSEWLSGPVGHHEFLNLRTYVRSGSERGIYFLSEWIPNRLAVVLGPMMYGLPYRLGRLEYRVDQKAGRLVGKIESRDGKFQYAGCFDPTDFKVARPDSLDHFLVERYVAFTTHEGVHRRFDVAHEPWPLVPLRVELRDVSLLRPFVPVLRSAQPELGHYSTGVSDVLISFPQRTYRSRSDTLLTLTNIDRGAFRYVQSPC